MKTHKNTQGSVWMIALVVVAVLVSALILSGALNLPDGTDNGEVGNDEASIHGLVSKIDHEEKYFLLTEIKVLSVAEDGSAETRKTEYVVSWTNHDSDTIQPHHPNVLDGEEMVRVIPREPLTAGQNIIKDPQSIEVTRVPYGEIQDEDSPAATTSTTSDQN